MIWSFHGNCMQVRQSCVSRWSEYPIFQRLSPLHYQGFLWWVLHSDIFNRDRGFPLSYSPLSGHQHAQTMGSHQEEPMTLTLPSVPLGRPQGERTPPTIWPCTLFPQQYVLRQPAAFSVIQTQRMDVTLATSTPNNGDGDSLWNVTYWLHVATADPQRSLDCSKCTLTTVASFPSPCSIHQTYNLSAFKLEGADLDLHLYRIYICSTGSV
jgi:hypothetical protein